jgi:hypothetical protein
MQDFKKTLDFYFREDTRELPTTLEDYKKRLEEPIRCLTELEFGKIYDISVRGVLNHSAMQLDDIKIYGKDGEIIFYFNKIQQNLMNEQGKPSIIPYKVSAEDVWLYRTKGMITELVDAFKRRKAGEVPTPRSTAATFGTSTPKSAMASTATPKTGSMGGTPATQSAVATPKTGSIPTTPTTQSVTSTPRQAPANPPNTPNSIKL